MPDYEVQLGTKHPSFSGRPFVCKLVCTGITLDDPKKSELAGRFRAAPDDLFPAFPDGIAAFNEACQQEEVQQNGAHTREEPSERMLPFAVPCHEAQK